MRDRLVDYYYLPDGKVNYSTYWNGVSTTRYGYDGRGMIGTIRHLKTTESVEGRPLAERTYWRDYRDRITAWQRGTNATLNGKENGTGNKFQYDAEGQLTDAWYLAQDPAGSMSNPRAREHFKYDQLGNRTGDNVLNGYGTRKFLGRDNGLNQYLSWGPWPANYDATLTWPANGVLMQEGNITAGFNALNQPMFISGRDSRTDPIFPPGTRTVVDGHNHTNQTPMSSDDKRVKTIVRVMTNEGHKFEIYVPRQINPTGGKSYFILYGDPDR